MKKFFFISITLLVGILLLSQSACKPKHKRLPVPAAPFVKMKINGVEWQPDKIYVNEFPYITYPNNRFSFNVDKVFNYNNQGYPDYTFFFIYLKKEIGKQPLFGENVSTIWDSLVNLGTLNNSYGTLITLQQAGEFLCEQYQVLNDAPESSWLEIIQEEDNYKRIWGKFSMKMYRSRIYSNCPIVRFSDTVSITNGTFYIEIP